MFGGLSASGRRAVPSFLILNRARPSHPPWGLRIHGVDAIRTWCCHTPRCYPLTSGCHPESSWSALQSGCYPGSAASGGAIPMRSAVPSADP